MENKITLSPPPLKMERKGQKPLYREGFYIRKESEEEIWLGHQDENGDYHDVRVSKEFSDAFIKESERIKEKYQKILSDGK